MKNFYKLSEPSIDAACETVAHTEFPMSPDRIPRGIEIEENSIFFYCPVGEYEALELNRLLRRLDVEMQHLSSRLGCRAIPIHLRIHSPGGSLFAGLSIYDTIKSCKSTVHTYVDGSAASAATLLVLAGKKRSMSKNSFMLIHQQQLEWAGKLDDFMDEVENQKELTETLTKIYLDETDISEEQLRDIMSHELWLNSKKCLELGLIDSILS